MSLTTKPTNTPNHLRSWSVVDDEELRSLRKVAEMVRKLVRGCACDYDYRCGNCQNIVDILNLANNLPK